MLRSYIKSCRGSEQISAEDQLWVSINNTGEDSVDKDQIIIHQAWWGELPNIDAQSMPSGP
jgi:hypothetical protein